MRKYRFATLYSGSEGNCTFICSGNTSILIDAGKSARTLCARLAEIGSDIKNISAIFITHEHTDHVSALETLSKKYHIPIHITDRSATKFDRTPDAAVHSCLVRHDTVWLAADNGTINNKVWSADTLSQGDSVRAVVPIQQLRYSDDSTFVAVVSGYRARLDSLVLLRRESHTTLRTPRPSPPRVVISAGPQAGIYRTPVGWQTGIGFGIGVGITLAPRRDNK